MKCRFCSKKPGMLKCRGCQVDYCSGCIQLESHCCVGLEDVKRAEIERLTFSLPAIVKPKVDKL